MTQEGAGRDRALPQPTGSESPARPPKIAIYDRPASADRPHRRWLAVIIAMAGAAAWLIYWYWIR